MSDPTPLPPSASELLLQARTAKELTLDQVSLQTRIPRELIQALEEKNWNLLPGAPYARAFCKTLAHAYDLDEELVLTGLRNDMGLGGPLATATHPRSTVEIRVSSSKEESRANRTPMILAAILALALMIVLAATRLAFKPMENTPADSLYSDSMVTDTSGFDSMQTPGLAAAAMLDADRPDRRTATLKLADTSHPTFILYMRQGASRIRKKNLSATDTLEFNPDTTIYVRNLSRQKLNLSGAIQQDSLVVSFFRVFRRNDSAKFEPISEEYWNEKAKPILERKKSQPTN